MLINFPLLLISFAIYNFIAFFETSLSWADQLFLVRMQSGVSWAVSRGDGLIALSIFLLFFEMLKATRTSPNSRYDHLFSVVVSVAALIEFILVPKVTTSTFAILVLLSLVDGLGGWTISIRAALGRRAAAITPQPASNTGRSPDSPPPASDSNQTGT